MCDRNETLNRCRKLLDTPNKADRTKEPPKCRCCPYHQPDFRYRICLFSECPYGKARNTAYGYALPAGTQSLAHREQQANHHDGTENEGGAKRHCYSGPAG